MDRDLLIFRLKCHIAEIDEKYKKYGLGDDYLKACSIAIEDLKKYMVHDG